MVAIGFADDLALLVRAIYAAERIVETNMALMNVDQWLLELALAKSESVIIKGHDCRKVRELVKF